MSEGEQKAFSLRTLGQDISSDLRLVISVPWSGECDMRSEQSGQRGECVAAHRTLSALRFVQSGARIRARPVSTVPNARSCFSQVRSAVDCTE